MNYGKPNSRFPSFVGTGDVSPSAFAECDFIVVTGSSQNHILPNVNMMLSVVRANCNASIVFVDYGLDDDGVALLSRAFSLIHSMHTALNSPAELYYRKFDFAHFPAWMDIMERKARGGYAWKVVAYFDVLNQTKRIVNWSDGGNLWQDSYVGDLERAVLYGLYTPYSGDSLQTWVHGKTRLFLHSNRMIRKFKQNKGMCTGGYLFVNYRNAAVMNDVILPLLQCSYTQRCVSPVGSSRKNHRQDQAVLSSLVHSANVPFSCNSRYKLHVSVHKDCGNKCVGVMRNMVNSIASRYSLIL